MEYIQLLLMIIALILMLLTFKEKQIKLLYSIIPILCILIVVLLFITKDYISGAIWSINSAFWTVIYLAKKGD
tara:strand:+ start:951 stop:1169 length:219 start_codon:yes stop_codon:yes gene_type:complete